MLLILSEERIKIDDFDDFNKLILGGEAG